jgi:membrane protein DedA with SNARE-associated domain
VEHVTQFFLNLVDSFGYAGLFVVMVFGNCGMPVGTELILPAAGALAATGHLSSWWLAAAVATVAELVGGSILYAIGYYGGRPFVVRWGKYVKLDEAKLDRFHAFYERHGSVVVFVCRFIPFVRGVSGLPAGVSRMQIHQFLLYTALGSAIFCFGLAWLGYVFGRHIDDIMPQLHRYSLGLLAAVVVGAGVWIALRLFGRARPGNAAR